MLHTYRQSGNYGITRNIFRIEKYYKSYFFVDRIYRNSMLNPNFCTSIDLNKRDGIKKALSEGIERKALMCYGSAEIDTKEVPTFNLMNKEISFLPKKFSSYRLDLPFISDTTGTAAHCDSHFIVKKALEELLEKNILFLFWYGRKGFYLPTSYFYKHKLYVKIKQRGYEVNGYISNYFQGLYTVIFIVKNDNQIISSGISLSLSLKTAIDKSLEEAYLLIWETLHNNIKFNINNDNSIQINHLKNFKKFEENIDLDEQNKLISQKNTIEEIISKLPQWISNIHVIFLKTEYNKNLNVIKLFSYDLYNHLPLKLSIDLSLPINTKTINLKYNELHSIPECIIK